MAPRDRGSIRKVATSGPKVRFGHRRPSRLDGGSPLSCRLQACPAGEPWHQFVVSGCRAASDVLSYGRTPLERAIGWLRCLVGSCGVRTLTVGESARRPTKVGSRDRKVARDPGLCIGMSAGLMSIATMVQGAHRLDARGATSSLPAAPQASTEVLPAGSRDEGIRRRDM